MHEKPIEEERYNTSRKTDLIDACNVVRLLSQNIANKLNELEADNPGRKMTPKETADVKKYSLTLAWLVKYLNNSEKALDINQAMKELEEYGNLEEKAIISEMIHNFVSLWAKIDSLKPELREYVDAYRTRQLDRFKRSKPPIKGKLPVEKETLDNQEKLMQKILDQGEVVLTTSMALKVGGETDMVRNVSPYNRNMGSLSADTESRQLVNRVDEISLLKSGHNFPIFDQVLFQYQYERTNSLHDGENYRVATKNSEPVVEIRYNLSHEGEQHNQAPDGRGNNYHYLLRVPRSIAEEILKEMVEDPKFIRNIVRKTVLDEEKGVQANIHNVFNMPQSEVRFASREDVRDAKDKTFYGEGIPPFSTDEWQKSQTFIHVEGLEEFPKIGEEIHIPILNRRDLAQRDKTTPTLIQIKDFLERTGQI